MTELAFDYRDGGDTLVLFIHGLGCVKESFAGAFDEPGLSGYQLLAPDLPGHGASPPGPAGMEDHARALSRLLTRFRFSRLHVVAHSMGGAVGLLLADGGDLPVTVFVNIEGNLAYPDCGLLSRRTAATPRQRFREQDFPRLVDATVKAPEPAIRMWGQWMAQADGMAFHESAESLVDWTESGQLLDLFRDLAVPKIFVCGGRSAVPEVLDMIKGISVKRFRDAGHFVMNEVPSAFYPWLARWLAAY